MEVNQCRRAGRIIQKPGVHVRQSDFMVKAVLQRVPERAGQQLAREVDAQDPRIRIEGRAAGLGGCATGAHNDDTLAPRPTRLVASRSVSTFNPDGSGEGACGTLRAAR